MKFIILLFLLTTMSPVSFAEKLCNDIPSKTQGHWQIPESAFTSVNAFKAQESLNSLMDGIKETAQPITLNNSVGLYSEIKNHLIMIEGYILRSQALDSLVSDTDNAFAFKKTWCDFYKHQATVWH